MTVTQDPVRVGLIGNGRSGSIIHAPLIEGTPGYRITAIGSSNPDAAKSRRDAPRVYAAPSDLIADPDIDLVVIATPNDTHVGLATEALTSGKHVVVDKPFALTASDTKALHQLARSQGRTITSFQNRRWDGDFLAVREALAGKMVGKLLLCEAYWDRFRPDPPAAWRNSAEPGAGVLWDLGPHMIDQTLLLFGTPDRVSSDVASQRQGAKADDYFHVTLAYGQLRCLLSASSVVAAPRPRFALHGTAGSLVIYGLDPTEDALIAGKAPATDGFREALPPIRAQFVTPSGTETLSYRPGDWTGFYAALRVAIVESGELPVSEAQTVETIRIIEACHHPR